MADDIVDEIIKWLQKKCKALHLCYKTIKKEQNLRNKYVLLASSIREKLAEAKEVRDELCNNKKHKIQKRKSKRNV